MDKSIAVTSVELRRSAVALAVVQWDESPPTQIPGSPVRYIIDNAIKVLQPLSEENISETFIVLLFRKTRCGRRLRRILSFSDCCRTQLFSECEPVFARFVAFRTIDFNGRFGVIEMREVL